MAQSSAPGEGGGRSSVGELVYTFVLLPWLPCGSDGKESACTAGDPSSIPGSGRFLPGQEKGMATYSSILAWRISWTEELGGLQ